jgi:nicotinamidase-related amidase
MLPIPPHFDATKVGEVWRVPYQQRADEAIAWAESQAIAPAATDSFRICLLLIDVQNTFCIPGFELYVGGRSGMGAVDDNGRLCEFIYRNLGALTEIAPTMDTHTATQIFHPFFWVDNEGKNPPPMTMISVEDVESGTWSVNPAVGAALPGDRPLESLEAYALHYVRQLGTSGKYLLTVWPYHSMLGGIGHALVSSIEEACFFHSIARQRQTFFELKGNNPLTENYSVLKPEVLEDEKSRAIAQKNTLFIDRLLSFDAVVIAGQAKSHCVAWTIDDLLREIQVRDPQLARKVYLLEDCTSPVVVPGVVDFTDSADEAFQRFADAGMNLIRSQDDLAAIISQA